MENNTFFDDEIKKASKIIKLYDDRSGTIVNQQQFSNYLKHTIIQQRMYTADEIPNEEIEKIKDMQPEKMKMILFQYIVLKILTEKEKPNTRESQIFKKIIDKMKGILGPEFTTTFDDIESKANKIFNVKKAEQREYFKCNEPSLNNLFKFNCKGGKKTKRKRKTRRRVKNERKKTKKNKRKQKGGTIINDCINKEDPISMEELNSANMVKFKVRDPTKKDDKIYNCYNKDTLRGHIKTKIDFKVSKDHIKDPLTNKTIDEDFIKTNYPDLFEEYSKLKNDKNDEDYDDEDGHYEYGYDEEDGYADLTAEQYSALELHKHIFRNEPDDYVYKCDNATISVTKTSTPQEIFDWYTEWKELRPCEQSNRRGGKSKKNKRKYIKRKSFKKH